MRLAWILPLAAAAAFAQFGAVPPAAPAAAKVSTAPALTPPRQAMQTVEKLVDTRLYALGSPNDPVEMLCCTRGLYLSNYGPVFLSEMSLIITPSANPFRTTITKEMKDQVHQKKVDRLSALRKSMADLLKTAVQNLPQVPDSQVFVVAVRLDYLSWEDRTGLPAQLVARADRKTILAGNVQVTEEQ